MIPFARILNYGNILVRSKIKQVVKPSGGSYYVLMDDGQLWVGGANADGQLGINNTTAQINKLVLSRSDVRLVSAINTVTAIVTNDNKIYFAGSSVAFDGNSTKISTWQDITNTRFSGVDISSVVDIAAANWIQVLTSTGNLYSTGYNALGNIGNGTTTAYNATTPYLTATDVKQMYVDGNHTYYIKNNGEIWGCGNNGYGATYSLDVTLTSNQQAYPIPTPQQMFKTLPLFDFTQDVFYGQNRSAYIARGTGLVSNMCGSGGYGESGVAPNSSATVGILSPNGNSTTPGNPKLGIDNTSISTRYYITTDNKLYSVGYNYNGTCSTGSTNPTSSPVYPLMEVTANFPGNVSDIKGIVSDTGCTFVWTDYDIYMCGTNYQNMTDEFGNTGNTLKLTKLNSLPF